MVSRETLVITGSQIRAGRALLGWTGHELASAAGVGRATIARAEAEDGPVAMMQANVRAIRAAFDAAGVILIDENGEGPGARLRKNMTTAE